MPVDAINRASAADKSPSAGAHPKGLHRWWGRLPLPAARAVVFGILVEDPSTDPEWKGRGTVAQRLERERRLRLLQRLISAHPVLEPEVFEAAKHEVEKSSRGSLPHVLDPFCGGGSIPLEAQRLGARAEGSDLDALAVLLNRAQLEYFPRFLGRGAVNPQGVGRAGHHAGGIVNDLQWYGTKVGEAAGAVLDDLYPPLSLPGGGTGRAVAYLWARTVPCQICGAVIPLIKSLNIARKLRHRRRHLKPVVDDDGKVDFEVHEGLSPSAELGSVSSKAMRCFVCEHRSPLAYVRRQAQEGKLGHQLLAVAVDGGPRKRRVYLSAADAPHAVPEVQPPAADFLLEEIVGSARHAAPKSYGLGRYRDLFTSRQLHGLNALARAIQPVAQQVSEDAGRAWGPSDDRPLAEGGTGALAYSQLIKLCLAFALNRTVEHSTALTRWRPGDENITSIFSRPSIPMTWDYAEANVGGTASGSWAQSLKHVIDSVSVVGGKSLGPGQATARDATATIDLQNVIVVTDPPFLDNIPYGDLSAFFLPWLREVAGDLLPPPCPAKEGWGHLSFGDRGGKDGDDVVKLHGERGFTEFLRNAKSAHNPLYPLVVFFASKARSSGRHLGWEIILQGFRDASVRVEWAWAVTASQARRQRSLGSEALARHSVLVCRFAAELPEVGVCHFKKRLRQRLYRKLGELREATPTDREQLVAGLTAVEFSSSRVRGRERGPMTSRQALSLGHKLAEVLMRRGASEAGLPIG